MAKSVTRYDEAGNAVIREARPASNVRTAPRDVKAKGAVAVAEWNKANKPQPGKTGEQAMQIVERQIYKRAADMRAKKTISSTARSFSGGQLLEALSANNGPKVAPDAPVTQKRAAIASGMAARAANRTEAGGSDGGPKRRAAERFARVARGEKPFGGAAVDTPKSLSKRDPDGYKLAQRAVKATQQAKDIQILGGARKDQVSTMRASAAQAVRDLANYHGSKQVAREYMRVAAGGSSKGLTSKEAAESTAKPVADPAKVIEKRNETARSLAEQKKATGVDAGRGAAARDLVARNDRDLGRAGGSKPRGVGRAGQLIIAEAEGHMMQVARDTEGKVKFDGRRVDTVEKAKAYLKARGLPATTAAIKANAAKSHYASGFPSAITTAPPRDPAVAEANRAAGRERREALIASEKAADERMAAKPAKGSRAGKAASPYAEPANAAEAYKMSRRAAVEEFRRDFGRDPPKNWNADKIMGRAQTYRIHGDPVSGKPPSTPPSFIDKVNAAQAASDAARKNAPKPPATPPGPREHWNKIGAKAPTPADSYKAKFGHAPPPGMSPDAMQRWTQSPMKVGPGRTGDPSYELAVLKAEAGPPKAKGVTNDSAMGMKPPAPSPAAPPSSGMKMPTWSQVNTGLAVVGTGVAAAQAFNQAKQDGKSTGEAMGAGALAAAPGALMLGAAKAGLQAVGKVAAPVMATWGAYQGAKEDDNKLRGAARGALRSLDPSAIVTGIGAGTGLMQDGRGLGERAYDAVFGSPTQGRVSAAQAQTFAKADANYDHMGQGQPQATGERPGWSPEARIAAAQARGAVNLPYGGDPTQAPGYTPPKDRRPY